MLKELTTDNDHGGVIMLCPNCKAENLIQNGVICDVLENLEEYGNKCYRKVIPSKKVK